MKEPGAWGDDDGRPSEGPEARLEQPRSLTQLVRRLVTGRHGSQQSPPSLTSATTRQPHSAARRSTQSRTVRPRELPDADAKGHPVVLAQLKERVTTLELGQIASRG